MNAYGFKISDIKGEMRVVNLAKQLTGLYEPFKDYLKKTGLEETEVNFEEWIKGYFQIGNHHGLAAFITAMINEKEGLELCCNDDYEIIYFPAVIPWQTNERMRNMTKDQLDNIFHKWIGMLTDEEITIQAFDFD